MAPHSIPLLIILLPQILLEVASATKYTMAIVPKQINNPFFDFVRDGCEEFKTSGNLREEDEFNCLYVGAIELNATAQAEVIDKLILQNVSGIAVSTIDADVTGPVIDRAVEAGIPCVTFDSDAPESKRSTYIGTNDFDFGHGFAWLLSLMRPEGGKYAVISSNVVNLNQRVDGLQYKLQQSFPNTKWTQLGDIYDCKDRVDVALDLAVEISQNPEVNALVAVGGWPMFEEDSSRWRKLVNDSPNLLVLSADTLPIQLQLLSENYVDALVGQRPLEMGKRSADVLYSLASDPGFIPENKVFTGQEIYIKPGAVGIASLTTTSSDASGSMKAFDAGLGGMALLVSSLAVA